MMHMCFIFSMSMKVHRFCHNLWHLGKQLWGTEEEVSITQRELPLQAEPSRRLQRPGRIFGQSLPIIFSVMRALLRWE